MLDSLENRERIEFAVFLLADWWEGLLKQNKGEPETRLYFDAMGIYLSGDWTH